MYHSRHVRPIDPPDQFFCDPFSVISSAIAALLRELENSCDPHFSALTRTVWANVKNVSSQSAYMNELVPVISGIADLTRDLVEKKKYLRNLYDKAAS